MVSASWGGHDGDKLALIGDVKRGQSEELAGGGNLRPDRNRSFLDEKSDARLLRDLVKGRGQSAARRVALEPKRRTSGAHPFRLGVLDRQMAEAPMGLLVCGVDIEDGKLEHEKQLGADLVINAKTGNPAEILKKETGGGAHGVLITAPSLPAFRQGVAMTREHGICVLNGLPPGEFPLDIFDLVANCVTVRGSLVGTRKDMAECLDFAASGRVKADIEVQPLSSINKVFERLAHGDVPSRVVRGFVGTKEDEHKSKGPAAKKLEAAPIG